MSGAIELKHVANSSLAGQLQSFDQDVVRLGRRPDNDVAFDPRRDSAASGYHAEIRRERGAVVIVDMGSANGTFVNGQRVDGQAPLRVGDRIRLAQDGPEIAVVSVGDAVTPPPPPPPPPHHRPNPAVRPFGGPGRPPESAQPGARGAAGQAGGQVKQSMGVNTIMGVVNKATADAAHKERKKNRKTLFLVTLVALLAMAAAVGGFLRQEERAAEGEWAFIAEAEKSVYMVAMRDADGVTKQVGTAWVAAEGILATNVHVAVAFVDAKPDTTVFVRSIGPDPVDLAISKAVLHPGYKLFEELNEKYKPYDAARRRFMLGIGTPFDVALLKIADRDADKLAKPLTIATDEVLQGLRDGLGVASIGFPAEGKQGGGTDLTNPVSSKDFKALTRRSDIFYASAEDHGSALSLMYSLNTYGGASGSPVFDTQGNVIGLIASGDFLAWGMSGRIMAGSTSYGPRSDLVRELLTATAEKKTEERRQWMESEFAERFRQGSEPPEALAVEYARLIIGQQTGVESGRVPAPEVSGTHTGTVRGPGRGAAVDLGEFKASAAGDYKLILISRDKPVFATGMYKGRAWEELKLEAKETYIAMAPFTMRRGGSFSLKVYVDDEAGFGETRVTAVWLRTQ